MTAASLLELAERVEHRERERVPLALEKEIASAFGHGTYRPYTTSLDAALTLIDEKEWHWLVHLCCTYQGPHLYTAVMVPNTGGLASAEDILTWSEWVRIEVDHMESPAQALTAAALRARARAQKEQKDG